MFRRIYFIPSKAFFPALLFSLLLGCGGGRIKEASTDPTHINLEKIGNAYMLATQHFNRPPAKWEEL
ncbi:MAG: hypothetical protein EXR99_07760, partial [Gemmataceae bacterium]|nr:hypothetical protein [Gemmataceae bacterium]